MAIWKKIYWHYLLLSAVYEAWKKATFFYQLDSNLFSRIIYLFECIHKSCKWQQQEKIEQETPKQLVQILGVYLKKISYILRFNTWMMKICWFLFIIRMRKRWNWSTMEFRWISMILFSVENSGFSCFVWASFWYLGSIKVDW